MSEAFHRKKSDGITRCFYIRPRALSFIIFCISISFGAGKNPLVNDWTLFPPKLAMRGGSQCFSKKKTMEGRKNKKKKNKRSRQGIHPPSAKQTINFVSSFAAGFPFSPKSRDDRDPTCGCGGRLGWSPLSFRRIFSPSSQLAEFSEPANRSPRIRQERRGRGFWGWGHTAASLFPLDVCCNGKSFPCWVTSTQPPTGSPNRPIPL